MHSLLPMILCLGLASSLLQAQGGVEKLPPGVNTQEYDETTPVISKQTDRLYFTRTADPSFEPSIMAEDGQITDNRNDSKYQTRLVSIYSQLAGHDVPNPASSVYNQDIWFADIQDDQAGEIHHPGYPLNNALPNCLVSNGMEADEYIVLNQFFEDGSMYGGFSRVRIGTDGRSAMPLPMHIYQFNLTSSNVDLTMTPDGQILVMSMKREDSEGQNDLYVSFYLRDNVWSSPVHMGKTLNTPMQESSPHISPDKRRLYFSSNRPGGLGGTDIYVSERLNYSWLKWSEPVLLEGAANSLSDDSQPYFDTGMNYLYFASRRDGSSDIFRIRQTPRQQLEKPVYVRGKILSAETGQPVHSELFWGQHGAGEYLEYFNTYTGEFEFKLTEAEPYKFQPRKANHTAERIIVDPRGMAKQGIDTLDLVLYVTPKKKDPAPSADVEEIKTKHQASGPEVWKPATMTFYNINFIKGKTTILSKSRQALDELLQMMLEHPEMEILIEGHTDNVGDELALIDLSIRRAEAIRDYLAYNGINMNRMQVDGRGAIEALAPNSTEGGRSRNRRVEITMLK